MVGVGIGLGAQDRPVLEVLTRKGRPAGVPKAVEDVEVEVVETGEIFALGYLPFVRQAAVLTAGQRSSDKPPTVRFISPVDGRTLVGNVTLQVQSNR